MPKRYRIIEQRLRSKFYLLDKMGRRVWQLTDSNDVPSEVHCQYNVFYFLVNVDDEDDYEVFADFEDALDALEKLEGELWVKD